MGQLAFGVMKEVVMREPILHETSCVWVRYGEGVDLSLGQVLAVPGVTQG